MVTELKEDITMSKKIKKDNTYKDNYDRIFGQKENEELEESYKESRRQTKERLDAEYLRELKDKL
jgi:hypothetical protein|tara:strand:+ start:546 stop:740 length:195 start_codon:yes stop_codon:yes gene_type:complete